MTWVTIGLSAGSMVGMAIIFSYILGWANKAFHVEVDQNVEKIIEVLPGANCGGCGCVGCGEYAEAVVAGEAEVNKCTVGGEGIAAEIAAIMGVEVSDTAPIRPLVRCNAHYDDRLQRSEYRGEPTCAAAGLIQGVQGCTYGCLGFGDCVSVCNYDAIHIVDGLAVVDYEKCVGCGACVKACQRGIIAMAPFKYDRILAVTCSNPDSAKDVKAVCLVGCIGCKLCVKSCDLFEMQGNLSAIDYEKYSSDHAEDLKKAVDKCKPGCINPVGKPVAGLSEKTDAKSDDTIDDSTWWTNN
ncbi:MAG: RnfABCDGE type electron transport complex subunit B [Deltaproteobacteria bacterium]|nr:RnfABCDGE type electron transport complex subunit B [Deltaproteobacteria bacterium]